MSAPLTGSVAAVQALWTTHWAESAPVIWHDNSAEQEIPDPAEVPAFVHIEIEFGMEDGVAWGDGPRAVEREQDVFLTITVFARRGTGDQEIRRLLDAALDVYRGRNQDGLRYRGAIPQRGAPPGADGVWWSRSAVVSLCYRFKG